MHTLLYQKSKNKDRPVNGFGANKLTIDNKLTFRLSQGSLLKKSALEKDNQL